MAHQASSTRVAALTTPSGITIWHVEDYTVPVLSLEFAFPGGAAQDLAGESGLTRLMAGLLDEGAGNLDSEAFQEALEDKAIELSFDAGRDRLDGSLRSLAEHVDAAFDYLAMAVQAPRFDEDAVERVRAQAISGLKQDESDPQVLVRDALYRIGFSGHAYAAPVNGTLETLPKLTRAGLLAQHHRLVTRAGLHVIAVGAIAPDALIAGVERVFGPLPATGALQPLDFAPLQGLGTREIIDLDIPQSTLFLALPGLSRKDADFITGVVVNHILGGGVFTSRLWTEVREKRGLAYSVWSMLSTKTHANLFLAGTATSNERVALSLELIETEIARMAGEGPGTEELEKAKSYLAGSYALRFDSSRKIANELLEISMDDMGIDYIDKRNDLIMAVSQADAKRVAARLFSGMKPLVIAAGKPENL